mgnify:CR=1 FL=1
METKTNNLQVVKNDTEEKTYKPKEIADMLDISTQDIRNYCSTYKQILDENHIVGKHREFSKSDINKLKLIRYLSKEKHLKSKEIINYLTRSNKISNLDLILSMKFLFDDVRKDISSDVKKTIRDEMKIEFDKFLKNNGNNEVKQSGKHWYNFFSWKH